ncbi:hypothetical protein HY213_03300 [Candidatus Peregrinibacteria bacterium]|nr:hypothetical protein [Candidatus Peregrinibacteria bacterium]
MNVEAQIAEILERNRRVEREKAWELSWTRRLTIVVMTYGIALIVLWSLGLPFPLLQALIPSGGFFLSMFSLPWMKRWWIRWHISRHHD